MNSAKDSSRSDINSNAQKTMGLIYGFDWHSYINERLEYKPFQLPANSDDSIERLIELFVNKKSGKVRYAGKYLKKAFLEAPPVEQRKIGLALLTGNSTDTEWVCRHLNYERSSFRDEATVRWHPCYEDAVEKCWNSYHGVNCGKLILNFFDEDRVLKYTDEFRTDELYFWLCRRLVSKPWFKVDSEKLRNTYISINSYLFIMSQTADGISDDEARTLLYQWIGANAFLHKIGRGEDVFLKGYYDVKHNVRDAWGIDTAIFFLLKMGKENVVCEFIRWDIQIRQTFESYFDGNEQSADAGKLFAQTILDNFPAEYKYLTQLNHFDYRYIISRGQPLVVPQRMFVTGDEVPPVYLAHEVATRKEYEYDKMRKRNPLLQSLVDELNLTIPAELSMKQ